MYTSSIHLIKKKKDICGQYRQWLGIFLKYNELEIIGKKVVNLNASKLYFLNARILMLM